MLDATLTAVLAFAVDSGLVAAALVDRKGNVVAIAGPIAEEEAMPLVALVLHRGGGDGVAARLFAGEVVTVALDERDVAVGVAKRQLFVVAVLAANTPGQLELVKQLRDRVASALADADGDDVAPIPPGWGGGGAPPSSNLQLVEYGLTVRRERGKA